MSFIDTLIELSKINTECSSLQKQILAIEKDTLVHSAAIKAMEQESDALKHDLLEQKKKLDQMELEANELADEEQRCNEKMGLISKRREAESLQHELISLQERRDVIEELMLRKWNLHELVAKKTKARRAQLAEDIAVQQAEAAKIMQGTLELRQKLAEMELLIPALVNDLPEDLQEKYRRIQGRGVVSPISQAQGGACGACYYLIPNRYLDELRQRHVTICQGCHRLLYYSTQEQSDKATTTTGLGSAKATIKKMSR